MAELRAGYRDRRPPQEEQRPAQDLDPVELQPRTVAFMHIVSPV